MISMGAPFSTAELVAATDEDRFVTVEWSYNDDDDVDEEI